MDNTKENVKKTAILKIVSKILITLSVIAFVISGLYFLVTHQWQDEPVNYSVTNKYITPLGETMVSAHRAGKKLFPQGTMMAFEGCVNSEVFETDIFEFDVRITADEKLIILHDETLDELTDAVEYFGKTENYASDYTYDEIYNLNFGEFFKNKDGETPYKGLRGDDIPDNLRVATVTEALTYLENNGRYYFSIEIKDGGELGIKAADILYEILSEMNIIDRTVVASFNKEVLEHIDENYPDLVRIAYNVEVFGLYLDSLFNIDRPEGYYDFEVLQVPPDKYVVNLGTSKLVNYAHKNNIAVQYWTINDADKMAFLQDIGADAIITDSPDVGYEVLKSQDK
ncbi:MAG: hypothetical protein IKV76_03900 [Clostridia bacterium]|nr:hypothetical protein [Clostridia bacterium]